MAKYGKGLNCETVLAVKKGLINEPFNISDIKKFASGRNWTIPDTYINVCLANGTSERHSSTYKKYFIAIDVGKYMLKRIRVNII